MTSAGKFARKLAAAATVYVDGASRGNPGPAGAGIVFVDADGHPLVELSKPLGRTTNNVAEYLALVHALREAQAQGVRRLWVNSDSELLVKQLQGAYRVRNDALRVLYEQVRHAAAAFEQISFHHVPRERNRQADRLAGRAADHQTGTPDL
ncbi:MAG: ribonuclease HI family protein [Candidatus Omnitrophica bacterium]|nr:ribonuclease HI family protein [Candidatus Omnitrophota bacterium]